MIEISSVTKAFSGFRAIDNLSLHIRSGEYVALLGPNGAGKTTLVEMIEGLQKPDSGTIAVMGKTWKQNPAYLRNLMGISLQETRFIDKLTVGETLDLFGSFYGLGKGRSREVLQLIGLEEKGRSFTVNLSGGQRQKLALGIALLNQPPLLLLDEPTTGLDPNARRELWEILMTLKGQQRTTLILTTHYMEEAQYLCDRIVILDRGQILADGALSALLDSFAKGEIIELETSHPMPENTLQALPGLIEWSQEGTSKIKLTVTNITLTLPILLDKLRSLTIEAVAIECRKKTLDDLFVAMTGRRLNE